MCVSLESQRVPRYDNEYSIRAFHPIYFFLIRGTARFYRRLNDDECEVCAARCALVFIKTCVRVFSSCVRNRKLSRLRVWCIAYVLRLLLLLLLCVRVRLVRVHTFIELSVSSFRIICSTDTRFVQRASTRQMHPKDE